MKFIILVLLNVFTQMNFKGRHSTLNKNQIYFKGWVQYYKDMLNESPKSAKPRFFKNEEFHVIIIYLIIEKFSFPI
jgi:hypothetical protein